MCNTRNIRDTQNGIPSRIEKAIREGSSDYDGPVLTENNMSNLQYYEQTANDGFDLTAQGYSPGAHIDPETGEVIEPESTEQLNITDKKESF